MLMLMLMMKRTPAEYLPLDSDPQCSSSDRRRSRGILGEEDDAAFGIAAGHVMEEEGGRKWVDVCGECERKGGRFLFMFMGGRIWSIVSFKYLELLGGARHAKRGSLDLWK